jgi:YVTN family beta-propeller protein
MVEVGSYPSSIAVNPITNRIYVANVYDNTVTVIDGATNSTTTVPTGTAPVSVAANPVTNKIYVVNEESNNVTVIDGATNSTTTVAVGTYPISVAVNPVTNNIGVANSNGGNVTLIDEQPVQPIPLTTSISPLVGNQTGVPNPSFTFTAASTTVAQPNAVFFQVDTWQNAWSATAGSNPTFTGTLSPLQLGFHILYVYAADGEEASSTQLASPLTGSIQAYGFLITPQSVLPQTISFAAIPTQAVGTPLTLVATASSGLPVTFDSSTTNVCTVSGTTATFISGGTCTITASQQGNGTYAPAQAVSQSFTVLNTDATTQGTWAFQYGADGFLIANDGFSQLPAYATVSLTGATAYTWVPDTPDARALQIVSGAPNRIASTYFAPDTFTINVNLTDGNTHRVALYLLDWDSTSRAETITIRDATTNTVLDSQDFSNFHDGIYAVWDIKGNVLIQITRTSGGNAVVSGIFFGNAVTSFPSAVYTGLDTTTQGTWTGRYGNDGFVIANNSFFKAPAYAIVRLTKDAAYSWNPSTFDVRALQQQSGSEFRIASTYYSDWNFTINLNLADSKMHRIALYLLDWDSTSRTETITILDANTKRLLDTESYSNFHNGEYAVWNIVGNVLIQVTATGGANAVASGIFFN